jgi:hypothetical protein
MEAPMTLTMPTISRSPVPAPGYALEDSGSSSDVRSDQPLGFAHHASRLRDVRACIESDAFADASPEVKTAAFNAGMILSKSLGCTPVGAIAAFYDAEENVVEIVAVYSGRRLTLEYDLGRKEYQTINSRIGSHVCTTWQKRPYDLTTQVHRLLEGA